MNEGRWVGYNNPLPKPTNRKNPQAQRILQSVLSYTLHKPQRNCFPTTPALVIDRDEQWQMDLVDIKNSVDGIRGTNIY